MRLAVDTGRNRSFERHEYLAREGERLTSGRGFLLSAAYVLGLASAFAALGAAAGWSGQNLQLLLQSPWTVGVMAGIFVVLALSMFGLFELQLPQAWTSRVARMSGRWGGSADGSRSRCHASGRW